MEKRAKRTLLLLTLAALIGTATARTPAARGQADQHWIWANVKELPIEAVQSKKYALSTRNSHELLLIGI